MSNQTAEDSFVSHTLTTSTKHYVEFYYPGTFFPETSVREIPSRDSAFVVPEQSYAYVLFDREEAMIRGEELLGNRKNESGMHYFGEIYSLERVREEVSDADILIRNMESNGYTHVVKTRRGNFQPLMEGDVVLTEVK